MGLIKKMVKISVTTILILFILEIIVDLMNQTVGPTIPSRTETASSGPAKIVNDRITKAKFIELETGMSHAQAVLVIGKEGELLSENNITGFHTAMYSWANWDGSNMNIMFQNDRLIQKAQFGRKQPSHDSITLVPFNQLPQQTFDSYEMEPSYRLRTMVRKFSRAERRRYGSTDDLPRTCTADRPRTYTR